MSTQRRGAQWIAQFMKNDRVRGIPKTGPQTVHLFTQCHSSPPCSRAWSALPEGPEWEYELKLDGYRLEAVKDGDKSASTRAAETISPSKFARIAIAVSKINLSSAASAKAEAATFILDGETVAVDARGKPPLIFGTLAESTQSAHPNW